MGNKSSGVTVSLAVHCHVSWTQIVCPRAMASEASVRAALASALAGADEAVAEYAVSVAQGVLDDAGGDTSSLAAELEDALAPLLADAGISDADVTALCLSLTRLCSNDTNGGGQHMATAGPVGDEGDTAPALLDLRGIILAYGGRVLLRPTSFTLTTGGRYGLVGANGVGKTTLLTRLAAGDILGFPAHVTTALVQHEAVGSGGSAVQFLQQAVPSASRTDIDAALSVVGFTPTMAAASVSAVSGGWRMRLALARSTLLQVDLLLLDEPTNHLDVTATAWLQNYVCTQLPGVTVVCVSHDASFLEAICTHIIYFTDLSLQFFPGGMAAFRAAMPHVVLPSRTLSSAARMATDGSGNAEQQPVGVGIGGESAVAEGMSDEAVLAAELAAASAAVAAGKIQPFVFPDPGPLDGIKSRNKVVLRATGLTFTHPGAAHATLKHVDARLCLASRVAVTGANGAGKTTLMKLLVGDIALPPRDCGEVCRHHSLRVAYVAQHALHHLEEAQRMTPVEYIQTRFAAGRDAEDRHKSTIALTAEEQALSAARGGVEAICGRRLQGGTLMYEVKKQGRPAKDNSWEPLSFLQAMPPYVMKLVRDYDERLKAMQGGMEVRPLTSTEVKAHLLAFGIGEELALSKIKGFSGGQKSRLVIAAAMWNRPHLLCLDEPTNYLDRESVACLAAGLKSFVGAVLAVSHSPAFVQALCTEEWHIEQGALSVVKERRTIED